MSARAFPQVRTLRDAAAFDARLAELGVTLPRAPDGEVAALAESLTVTDGSAGTRTIGNRWSVLPMEGWDANLDGTPSELVERRWRRFGASGAKLIWGGEAVAVRPDGRANPRQLVIDAAAVPSLARLRAGLVDEHVAAHGSADDLLIGLQLTHAGRYAAGAGLVAYPHPVLDARSRTPLHVATDDDLDTLVDDFVRAAQQSAAAGFDFVDIKHCHGYFGHELLSGVDRAGRYGGDFENRTRFLRAVVERVRAVEPGLVLGVRLSAFDFAPFPSDAPGYRYAFGGDGSGTGIDLTEAHAFVALCEQLGIGLVCITAGSPYYCPHIQRPAYFPPSDGYAPPEDPLVGVARLAAATAELKRAHPNVAMVSSGLSYLQEWLGPVGAGLVRDGWTGVVGIGRMVLSYPTLPADVLAGRPIDRHRLCRTFSDCTTAPRNGLVSGCYPIDELYKQLPERVTLAAAKKQQRSKGAGNA